MSAGRIRVLIAGNIYVKRALVRRFLEDDGYEVVAEARTREDMVAAIRRDQPDAIVVDDELFASGPGGGTIGRIRRAAPDAKVIVFTSSPEGGALIEGADAWLEKGLGLASLTAMLGRLFAEDAPAATVAEGSTSGEAEAPTVEMAPVAAGPESTDEVDTDLVAVAADGTSDPDLAPAPSPAGARRDGSPGVLARLVAVAAGAVLIVWGLGALIVSGRDEPAPRAVDRTDTTGGTVTAPAEVETPIERAYAALDELIGALEDGNYVLAAVDAQALMDLRDRARASGFALTGLDAEITARLGTLVDTLPERVNATLAEILGSLYPALAEDVREPGGGSDVVLGTTVSNTSSGSTSASGSGGSGTSSGGGGGNGGGGAGGTVLGPGDGREWGQSHRPPHAGGHGGHRTPPGQSKDHGKPPWAGR